MPFFRYVWLLKISYLWYGVVGYFVTFLVGWTISIGLDCLNMGGKKKMYLDRNQMYINTDLFSPPIANYLKKENQKKLAKETNVSNMGYFY